MSKPSHPSTEAASGLVLYQPMCHKNSKKQIQPKAGSLFLQRHLKFVSSKRNLTRERKGEKERERENAYLHLFFFWSKI